MDALALATSFRPDLVLLDIGLPDLDGLEVLRQIRTTSEVYVVMVTALAEEVDLLVGLSVGADDYVAKPFSPREVVARVKTVLRRDGTSRRLSLPRRRSHQPGSSPAWRSTLSDWRYGPGTDP